jgi:hypothetical protein
MTYLERREILDAIEAAGLTGKVIIAPVLDVDCECDHWHTTINGVPIPNFDGQHLGDLGKQIAALYKALWEPMR